MELLVGLFAKLQGGGRNDDAGRQRIGNRRLNVP